MARLRNSILTAVVLALATAAPAAAHGGAQQPVEAAGAAHGTPVKLRGCHLTAVMVPRPATALRPVFRRPLDLSRTFYGPDPLLGIWGIDCARARVGGTRAGRIVASVVGVPVGLTSASATPLANNFAHATVRIDTGSRVLANALRRAGQPARFARAIRYRHTRPGVVPFRGRLELPGGYSIRVTASQLDPTNPHDHANLFEHRGADGGAARVTMSIPNAVDRFCFPAGGGCSATVRAARGSQLAGLLGGRSAPVTAGFDHEKLARVDLLLRRGR